MNALTKQDVVRIIDDDMVSLDESWEWVGFSSKQMAKERLLKELEEGVDFTLNETIKTQSNGKQYPITDYVMTKEGFKQFAASAHTDKGREVRKYLVQIEKEYQNEKKNIGWSKVEYHLMEAMNAMMDRQRRLEKSYTKRVLQPQLDAPKYYTIKAWVAMNKDDFLPMSKGEYISLGRKAARLSKNHRYDIRFADDEHYGSVGSYHIDILKQL